VTARSAHDRLSASRMTLARLIPSKELKTSEFADAMIEKMQ
jgi:hypothetical protein